MFSNLIVFFLFNLISSKLLMKCNRKSHCRRSTTKEDNYGESIMLSPTSAIAAAGSAVAVEIPGVAYDARFCFSLLTKFS